MFAHRNDIVWDLWNWLFFTKHNSLEIVSIFYTEGSTLEVTFFF